MTHVPVFAVIVFTCNLFLVESYTITSLSLSLSASASSSRRSSNQEPKSSPFALAMNQHLFDDDDDDDLATKKKVSSEDRTKANGVLQFHEGTEEALLIYVRNQHPQSVAQVVLDAVDAFCLQRHWMMHCGPRKGAILQDFLLERYQVYHHRSLSHDQRQQRPFIIVELGSYCGYSAICMAQGLMLHLEQSTRKEVSNNNQFHIYSIDVHPKLLRIAGEMTQLAGMDHCISYHLLRNSNNDDDDDDSSLPSVLQTIFSNNEPLISQVDFLLLDHDKELYLNDLRQLERYGWLRNGSAVAADNVLFANIHGYRTHVQLAKYIDTRLVESPLEYQDDIPDGIELSVYIQDPTVVG